MINIGDKNLKITFKDADDMLEFFCGLDKKTQKIVINLIKKSLTYIVIYSYIGGIYNV